MNKSAAVSDTDFAYSCICEKGWRGSKCDHCEPGLKIRDGCTGLFAHLNRIPLPPYSRIKHGVSTAAAPLTGTGRAGPVEIRRHGESTSFVWATAGVGAVLISVACIGLAASLFEDLRRDKGTKVAFQKNAKSRWKGVATMITASTLDKR
jgi:hypothetical protein